MTVHEKFVEDMSAAGIVASQTRFSITLKAIELEDIEARVAELERAEELAKSGGK